MSGGLASLFQKREARGPWTPKAAAINKKQIMAVMIHIITVEPRNIAPDVRC
jgi:hypothetical protein